MTQNLIPFATWTELLIAARDGVQLWYQAPMDAALTYPAKQVRVVRVYKNGKLRLDPMSNQADPFTVDHTQLDRFRKRPGLARYKLHGRTICDYGGTEVRELVYIERCTDRNATSALTPTEADALTHWLLDRMNEPGFDLAAIHAAYMAK